MSTEYTVEPPIDFHRLIGSLPEGWEVTDGREVTVSKPAKGGEMKTARLHADGQYLWAIKRRDGDGVLLVRYGGNDVEKMLQTLADQYGVVIRDYLQLETIRPKAKVGSS